jgi:O-methyltransferase
MKINYTKRPTKEILINNCSFYHVQDLPGLSIPTKGAWDLRENVDEYLGKVNFKNKTVLELGPSTGYLTFHMEKLGGDITSIDLDTNVQSRDVAQRVKSNWKKELKDFMMDESSRRNGFWYAHQANNSNSKLIECHINDLPDDIGFYDISTICAVLLHLSNPFLALQKMLSHTKEKIIISEMGGYTRIKSYRNIIRNLIKRFIPPEPTMRFLPNQNRAPFKWWALSPEIIVNMANILGFEKSKVTYHKQIAGRKNVTMYTVVCERTVPIKDCNY